MPVLIGSRIVCLGEAVPKPAYVCIDEGSGKITSISRSKPVLGETRIQAGDSLVLPAAIDAHVHFRVPGNSGKEDFSTGTAAALAGGVSAVIDMPNTSPPTTSHSALEEKKRIARRQARCDYGFFAGATNANVDAAASMGHDASVAGLKMYVGSSTGGLLVQGESLLEHVAAFPSSKPVVAHAEDEATIQKNLSQINNPTVAAHHLIRSKEAAEKAVGQLISLCSKAGNRPLHIAHASTSGEIALVRKAREKGRRVSCEVTPHHLFLDTNSLATLGNFGKVNPPLRPMSEREALWSELVKPDSAIGCIASDHAPHPREEKLAPYADAPSGMPGVQTLYPLLLDCMLSNKLSLARMVQLVSSGPAGIFSIRGKAGIAVGNDADFVLVDPKGSWKVRDEDMFSKCGWTPYAGKTLQGRIQATYVDGKPAFEEGELVSRPGEGKALEFHRPSPSRRFKEALK